MKKFELLGLMQLTLKKKDPIWIFLPGCFFRNAKVAKVTDAEYALLALRYVILDHLLFEFGAEDL